MTQEKIIELKENLREMASRKCREFDLSEPVDNHATYGGNIDDAFDDGYDIGSVEGSIYYAKRLLKQFFNEDV